MTVGQLAVILFVAALACFALTVCALVSAVPHATYVLAFTSFLLLVIFLLGGIAAWGER